MFGSRSSVFEQAVLEKRLIGEEQHRHRERERERERERGKDRERVGKKYKKKKNNASCSSGFVGGKGQHKCPHSRICRLTSSEEVSGSHRSLAARDHETYLVVHQGSPTSGR